MSSQRFSMYIPEKIKEELEKIKKKYHIKSDKEAYIIYRAMELTGGNLPEKEEKKEEKKEKKQKKSSNDPIREVIDQKMAELLDSAIDPAVHTVKKTAEKIKEENEHSKEEDDRTEDLLLSRLKSGGLLGGTPSNIEEKIERKVEEAKRKLEEQMKEKQSIDEMKKTIKELKQELDYYVNAGYLSRLQEMKQIEELLNELGWSKEDKSVMMEVINSNLPQIIDLIDNISKNLMIGDVNSKFFQRVMNMIGMLERRSDQLERKYAEGKIDDETYSKLTMEIEKAIIRLTELSLKANSKLSESEEEQEESYNDEEVDDILS